MNYILLLMIILSGSCTHHQSQNNSVIEANQSRIYYSQIEPLKFEKKIISFKFKLKNPLSPDDIEIRLSNPLFPGHYYFYRVNSKELLQDRLDADYFRLTFGASEILKNGQFKDFSPTLIDLYTKLKVEIEDFRIYDSTDYGRVSLTFNGYSSLKWLKSVLRKHRARATVYIDPDLIPKWEKDTSQIEIAFSPLLPKANLRSYREDGKPNHFAYPEAINNDHAYLPLIRRYFSTGRLGHGGVETLPPTNWLLLRSINFEQFGNSDNLLEMAKRAKDNNQWLIINFGQMNSINDRAEFQVFLRKLKLLHIPIETIDDVFKDIHIKNAAD